MFPSCDSYETEGNGGNVDVDRMLSTMKVRNQSSERSSPSGKIVRARVNNWRCCDYLMGGTDTS
jgi:hypothetical protein